MAKDETKENRLGENGGGPRKTVSPGKLEANRRNARHSTGPKTSEGKKAVSFNALKHGLCSKEVVILSGGGREDPREYQAMLAELIEDCKPVGFLEGMLAEEIANCYWRLRRAYRVETAELATQIDKVKSDEHRSWEGMVTSTGMPDVNRVADTMKEKVAGIRKLQEILGIAIDEIRTTGALSEDTCELLGSNFGNNPDNAGFLDEVFDELEALMEEAELPRGIKEKKQKAALEVLRHELGELKRLEKEVAAKEKQELDLRRASLNLPVGGSADKILRYETATKRNLYRAMDQLERLQRRRQGENIPAPISIDVSTEK